MLTAADRSRCIAASLQYPTGSRAPAPILPFRQPQRPTVPPVLPKLPSSHNAPGLSSPVCIFCTSRDASGLRSRPRTLRNPVPAAGTLAGRVPTYHQRPHVALVWVLVRNAHVGHKPSRASLFRLWPYKDSLRTQPAVACSSSRCRSRCRSPSSRASFLSAPPCAPRATHRSSGRRCARHGRSTAGTPRTRTRPWRACGSARATCRCRHTCHLTGRKFSEVGRFGGMEIGFRCRAPHRRRGVCRSHTVR